MERVVIIKVVKPYVLNGCITPSNSLSGNHTDLLELTMEFIGLFFLILLGVTMILFVLDKFLQFACLDVFLEMSSLHFELSLYTLGLYNIMLPELGMKQDVAFFII